jgi:hypothetical protein
MQKSIVNALFVGVVLILAFLAVALGLRRSDVNRYDRTFVWTVDHDEGSGRDLLVRGKNAKAISRDIGKLVIAFNRTFAGEDASVSTDDDRPDLAVPRLRLQKVEDGVATVEIAGSEYLAERTGSAGAQNYLAAATFTLTECPQVRSVSFVFPGGDHAAPGTYTRESFAEYQIAADREQR